MTPDNKNKISENDFNELKTLKYNVTSIFEKFGISIFEELNGQFPSRNFNKEELDIIDEETSLLLLHQYFIKAIPLIIFSLKNIAIERSNNYFELEEVLSLFETLDLEIKSHINNEESKIFHLINYFIDCEKFKERPKMRGFRSVQHPIKDMEVEHAKINLLINRIKKEKNHFTSSLPNPDNNFKIIISEMHDFITALDNSIFLENQYLFPQTEELQNNLLNTY